MSSIKCDLDALEADTYSLASRREPTTARGARRESPRLTRRTSNSTGIGGMHKRRNKRWGL